MVKLKPEIKEETKQIPVRIPLPVYKEIERSAKKAKLSMNQAIVQLLTHAVEQPHG